MNNLKRHYWGKNFPSDLRKLLCCAVKACLLRKIFSVSWDYFESFFTNKYFYQQLQDVVNKILYHDIKIFVGDMNAQIGSDRSRFETALIPHAFSKWMENRHSFIQSCSIKTLRLFEHLDVKFVSASKHFLWQPVLCKDQLGHMHHIICWETVHFHHYCKFTVVIYNMKEMYIIIS